jgi:apolipoprotein N-acyltransferase
MFEKIKINVKKFINSFPKISLFLAGSLCALAFAPFNLFLVLLISLPIFYSLIVKNNSKKIIFLYGFCFGFGYFLAGIYWIAISLLVDASKFAWLIPFSLTLIPGFLALYFGFLSISFKFLIHKLSLKFHYQKILIFAILWVCFESMRSTLFSGFAWNLLGYSWLFSLKLSQSASLFGIYFLSFFAVIVSLMPLLILNYQQNLGNKISLFVILFFLLTNLSFGIFSMDYYTQSYSSTDKIRIVQANIKQEMKWQEIERYNNFLKHIELTRSMPYDNIRAVIWSETSVPYAIEDNPKLMNLLKLAVPNDGELITGGLRINRSSKNEIIGIYNSVFMINSQGILSTYDKHHLVPFGEYVPLQNLLSFLFIDDAVNKISAGGEGFSFGDQVKTLQAKYFNFNPLICYEVIFSNEVIKQNQNPEIFINITNDAWFGNSSGPYQHLAMTQMRAIEYATPLIRVAGTGISALIDIHGNIIRKIDLNEEGVIDVELLKNNQVSFYHRFGNIPLIFILVALGGLFCNIFKIFIKKVYLHKFLLLLNQMGVYL